MNAAAGGRGASRVVSGITIDHLWVLLPFVTLLMLAFGTPLRLLDFWWHLKVGQQIVAEWRLPQADVFSYTAQGEPFILQSWLSEVFYGVLYLLGGLELIVAANAVILVAALLGAYLLCRERLGSPRLCLLVLAPVAIVPLVINSSVRPQALSLALFSFYYWLLARRRDSQAGLVVGLPLLMLLWVNLHGAFPLGLGLIGIFGLEAVVARLGGDGTVLPRLKLLLWAGILSGLATLCNPVGLAVYKEVLGVLQDPASQRFVSEWQRPEILDAEGGLGFFLPFGMTLGALLLPGKRRLVDLLLIVVFAAFAWSALRNAIWFALVAGPIIAGRLASALKRRRVQAVNAAKGSPVNFLFVLLLVVLLVGTSPWVYPALKGKDLWEPMTPVRAADFIARESLKGRIFHPQIFGDFLIWRLWPQQQSFIDGRVHLFKPEIAADYFSVMAARNWERVLSSYDVRYLWLSLADPENVPLSRAARKSRDWRVLYEDEVAIVLERAPLAAPPGG